MFVFKCYYHIMAILKKILFKLIYGKRIKFGKGVTFRKGFSLIIEKIILPIIATIPIMHDAYKKIFFILKTSL